MSQSSGVTIKLNSGDKYQKEKYCMQHPLPPTFPNPCSLLLSWPSAQSIPEGAVVSKSNHRLHPTPTSLSNCAHQKGIRAMAFDLLTLHSSECSWAIVFHKGQNVDSTVQAKCKLETLHIAFLWLTQASSWKRFPKVTAKFSTKVSCMEDVWHEGANEVAPRVRTSVSLLNLDLGRVNLPLRTFL